MIRGKILTLKTLFVNQLFIFGGFMKIGFHKDIFKPSLSKSIAVFLVFVFAWTNLGLYQVV
jgi:hypothetical protein